ncbi:MAG: SagB/ThcOx family dehydrogenase [Candidatus Hermodarchaeota archaeon]
MKSKWILFSIVIITLIISLFSFQKTLQIRGVHQKDQLLENEVFLPSPDIQGSLSLDEAIMQFKPIETDFSADRLTLAQLGQLLWSGQGITHAPFRAAPSAGATYPLELFAVIGSEAVIGVNEGVYSYDTSTHRLKQLLEGDFREQISELVPSTQKTLVTTAPVSIIILAEYNRTTERYGLRGIQYVHLEVGHVIQNICLQTVSLDLHIRALVRFNTSRIKELLETKYEPLTLLPVGKSTDASAITSIEGINCPNIDSKSLTKQNYSFPSEPLPSKSSTTVEQAIFHRKSQREYLSGSIDLSLFSELFWMSYGCHHPETGNRTFYSISDRFPVNLSIVVGEVTGLSPGLYNYLAHNHTFFKVRDGDFREELAAASLDQEWVRKAQFNIVMTVDYSLLTDLYLGDRDMVAQFEAGMCAENFYLKTTALGLGMVVIGAFSEAGLRTIIQDASQDQPIYVISVGLIAFEGEIFPTDGLSQPLYYWGDLASFLALSLFYLTIFVTTPVVQRKWKREARWLHYILSGVTALFMSIHVILILGYGTLIQNPLNFPSYYYLFRTLLTIPYLSSYSLYDIGLIVARIAFISSVLLLLLILPILRAPQNRKIMFLHKCFTVSSVFLIILHALLNGRIVALNPLMFLLLNGFTIIVFLILRQEPEWFKNFLGETNLWTKLKNKAKNGSN